MSLTEYRCPKCGRLLFKSDADRGVVQTVCGKCKAVRMVAVQAPPTRLAAVRA